MSLIVKKKLARTKQHQSRERNKIQTESNSLKSRLIYYQDHDDKLRQVIRDLQNQINNHTCPSCLSDYREIKGQRNNYQQ